MSDEEHIPDIFADSVTLTAGPFGFTLSLYLSDPANLPKPGDEPSEANLGRLVGRVRAAPELMAAFLPTLSSAVDATRKVVEEQRAKASK